MGPVRRVSTFLSAAVTAAALLPAQDSRPPQAHFHHVHLNTINVQASIDFYSSRFDWQKQWVLFSPVAAPPPHQIVSTIWHIGWGAEDMPAAYQKQLESGTRFETPLTDISDLVGQPKNSGKFYYAYVDSPDHALVELNTANHHHFGHLHLLSSDPVAAAAWYETHLGIPVRSRSLKERIYEGFPVSPSASLQAGIVNIIIFPVGYARKQWPELWKDRGAFETTSGRAIDHVAFSVDDLRATLDRLRAAGVRIVSLPQGPNQPAFIEGPDRISIELLEDKAAQP
jgi:catechol 2,3-dioxygenase-like lactoylglutathione lyase family enzyme